MRKISIQKKGVAVASSLAMVASCMAPISAFAEQTPSVDYTGGDGSNVTHLYLIADDTNLANNNTIEYNQTNAKVQVPVAINYVAQANGNITGPADEQAQIRNFSGFPVNVTNIKVNAGTNVTLVNTAAAADTADEIYLQMKPNTGTILAMADYTASATESASGLNDGTGKRPEAGEEWNIAAAQSGVGTSSAVASVLNLNSLSGKIGGFNRLDPAQKQEIGQIEWTVKAGTYANSVPALPASQAALASTSLSDLSTIGTYLRSGNADASYVSAAEALVGATMNVTLADNSTMAVRLADVSTTRGLTFEAVNCLPTKSTTGDNWSTSGLRTSLNSGDLYTQYFAGTTLDTYVRAVDNSSFIYNGGEGGTVASNDRYFVPSANNIYGAGWPDYYGATNGRQFSDGVSEAQFDYYANLDPALDPIAASSEERLVKKVADTASAWWLRSASPAYSNYVMLVHTSGSIRYGSDTISNGVAPCFCL